MRGLTVEPRCQESCVGWTIPCTETRRMTANVRARKRAFDIHEVLRRIRQEVKQFADAAMFDLAAQGFATPFHQLAACIISVRTFDEVSLPAALRLFKQAPA